MPNTTTPPWDELLKTAQAGDKKGSEQLLLSLTVTLAPILQSRLRGKPKEDLEDILQETLLTFLSKLSTIENNPHKFAAIILRNKIGDYYRSVGRTTRQIPIETNNDDDLIPSRQELQKAITDQYISSGFPTRFENSDQVQTIKGALKHLPKFCQAFFMGLIEQHSRDEIFGELQNLEPTLSRGTFRKRIFDCRQRLKGLLYGA